MTRIKKGLDYFCFTTDTFIDHHIKRLRRLCRTNGLLVYFYLINEAFRVEGYYVKVNDDLIIDAAEYFYLSEEEVKRIIDICCKEGFFDKEIFARSNYLTSATLQERYIYICKKLHRSDMDILPELMLIDPAKITPLKASKAAEKQPATGETDDSSNVNSDTQNGPDAPLRKEMKGKEKKRNEMKSHPSVPSLESERGEGDGRPVGTSVAEGGDTLRLPLDEVSADGVPAGAAQVATTVDAARVATTADAARVATTADAAQVATTLDAAAVQTVDSPVPHRVAKAPAAVPYSVSVPPSVPPGSAVPIGSLLQKATPMATATAPSAGNGTDILPDPHTPCPRGEGRNYWGMVEALQRFRLPVRDINAILKMSNFGEIGDPAWRAIYEVNNSGGTIRQPAKYIYSIIQKARHQR